jgi:hypothetical protein
LGLSRQVKILDLRGHLRAGSPRRWPIDRRGAFTVITSRPVADTCLDHVDHREL